jgi:hypothetical protein
VWRIEVLVKKIQKNAGRKYIPSLGYIGNKELKVPNYLFSTRTSDFRGYDHCLQLANSILNRPANEQLRNSKALTDFLRKREMTFSKLTPSGEYKIFR